jgi:hypothetical protein
MRDPFLRDHNAPRAGSPAVTALIPFGLRLH